MEKTTIAMCLIFGLMLIGSVVVLYNENSYTPSELKRNYNFDIAIGTIAEARVPTQFDIPVGIIEDEQGNQYQVYESRTLVTNDFSKLFVGGRV
jgi:hypothetical protein